MFPFVQGWLDETAESLQSLDPNHLVSYSSEGFLGSSTPGEIPADACSLAGKDAAIMHLHAAVATCAPSCSCLCQQPLEPDTTASQQPQFGMP